MKVVNYGACTAPGTRRGAFDANEDAFLLAPKFGVFGVFDGTGGHPGGAQASALAARVVEQALGQVDEERQLSELGLELKKRCEWALLRSTEELLDLSSKNPGQKKMGTTAVLIDTEEGMIVWCGDSRAYLMVGEGVEHLTIDHSPHGDAYRDGRIPWPIYEMASTPIVRKHIGSAGACGVPEAKPFNPGGFCRVLLLSDGLLVLNSAKIGAILSRNAHPTEIAEALVKAALEAEGRDDITALVLDIDSDQMELGL